ncbi:MAG: cell division protein FtsQ/DivIB [Armatimonadota bacterium]
MNRQKTTPAAPRRRRHTRSKSGVRNIVIILLLLVLMIEVAVVALTSPYFNVKNIVVADNITIPDNKILGVIDLPSDANIFRIKTRAIHDELMLDPVIKSVRLHRKLPGTLIVSIVERQADLILDNSGSMYEVDASGMPFRVSKKVDPRLAVVSYNIPKKVIPGKQITDHVFIAAQRCLALSRIDNVFAVSKIAVDQNNDLCLNVRDGFIIKMGRSAQLEYKIDMAAEVIRQKPDFRKAGEYIDVTCPDAPAVKYK